MRRVGRSVVVVGLLGVAGIAGAEPWTLTMEGGGEADSNVMRAETGGQAERIAAPVGRAGARIDRSADVLGGSYVLGASGLARMVASSRAKSENVMLYAGDLRWLHAIGARRVAAGLRLIAADAFAMAGGIGARTFRNLGGDALIALRSGEDRHLTLAVGGRAFSYKPDHEFDWNGPVANARLDLVLWRPPGKAWSLELVAGLGFESRSYASNAVTNLCPPAAPPSALCSAGTRLARRDRFERAHVELNWMGEVVATAGYQLTVIDSNSYGQSLVRHRIATSATTEPIHKLFVTATVTLQIDQYPDGLLVERDVQRQEFTNLEDESRSSLQLRIARELSTAWSLEARGAVWRDLGNAGTAAFRRELIYAGVIYAR